MMNTAADMPPGLSRDSDAQLSKLSAAIVVAVRQASSLQQQVSQLRQSPGGSAGSMSVSGT